MIRKKTLIRFVLSFAVYSSLSCSCSENLRHLYTRHRNTRHRKWPWKYSHQEDISGRWTLHKHFCFKLWRRFFFQLATSTLWGESASRPIMICAPCWLKFSPMLASSTTKVEWLDLHNLLLCLINVFAFYRQTRMAEDVGHFLPHLFRVLGRTFRAVLVESPNTDMQSSRCSWQ